MPELYCKYHKKTVSRMDCVRCLQKQADDYVPNLQYADIEECRKENAKIIPDNKA